MNRKALEGSLNSMSLVFRSAEVESEYWRRKQPRLRRRTVIAMAVALVLYSLYGILDRWIVPEVLMQVWAIRASMLVLCLAMIGLTRSGFFARAHQLVLLSLPLLGGVGILVMVAIAGETGRLLYYAFLILGIIWTMLFADLRFLYALAASLYMVVGYLAIALFVRPLPLPVVVNNTFFLAGALVLSAAAGYEAKRASRVNFYQALRLEQEQKRSEALLLNILPREVSEELKARPGTIARRFEEASILFADIVGFTSLSARMSAEQVVELLNEAFCFFDTLVDKYDVEKIRTIGDNYMVVAGVPRPCPHHARALAEMALEMRDWSVSAPPGAGERPMLRIGIGSGPVVAGVIGTRKFQYDVWGDAVNQASRMESQGQPGQIQLTRRCYELLRRDFRCERRGCLEVKGVGPMDTWFLTGRRAVERASA